MRRLYRLLPLILLILISFASGRVSAQLGFDLKLDKPAPYEERTLRSEKTGEKPLKPHKKFFQNLTTHYNYYYNASTKLNEVIEGAKEGFKDDYTLLLPFYNYTLDKTAENSVQLDSVVYKAQTGIVMHDLRNDWIDNLYLLWGAAWFLEKKFDSAALMFQFINYSFAKKDKDGYYQYIGSRMDGNNALSISTEESKKFPKNLVTPPSRNPALVWLIRTMIEMNALSQAGTLIATLKNDPLFPERLDDDLEEVEALWYYKQHQWDSSATHLVKALDQARNKGERARWEYLAAQMFEEAGLYADAEKYFLKSIGHTTDPVMDIYARLNLVRINKEGGENYIDKNIAELIKMAKRDKYVDYRDVIYFMAAQMEIERHNFDAAQALLMKGAKYNNNNLPPRSQAYLIVADLSWTQRKYLEAARFYDSVQTRDLQDPDLGRVQQRKALLSKVVSFSGMIHKEDSLQRIAGMPEEERTVYITRLVKQLRKQQGLSDENTPTSGNPMLANQPSDLFATPDKRGGEWYFYNNTLKTQGIQQFKQVWGNRPNVDNWRRFADVNQQLLSKVPTNVREPNKTTESTLPMDNTPSFTALMNNLPTTPEKLQVSNDSIQFALFGLGTTYMNDIEDYASAIEHFEELRRRFPNNSNMNEVLFDLHYAYTKTGNQAKAAEVKNQLLKQYPDSRFAAILTTGKDPVAPTKSGASTQAYEAVYDLFLEGKFEQAIQSKKAADSLYKTSYWQPQLLYIEAVYHIRQRSDSAAKTILQTLIAQDPNAPLAKKAQNLLSVLDRRKEIEAELASLQVNRPAEDSTGSSPVVQRPPAPRLQQGPIVQRNPPQKDTSRATTNLPPAPKDTTKTQTAVNKPPVSQPNTSLPVPGNVIRDSAKGSRTGTTPPPVPVYAYRFEPGKKHYVMIILDKVDPLFVNEVKNAYNRYNRERMPGQTLQIDVRELDADKKLVLIGNFANAQESIDYLVNARKSASTEVMPWLKADKYVFSIMTDANLEVLLQKKDLVQYRQFLDQNLPGKF